MSLILKGIDLPNSGQIELIIRPHGKVVVKTRGIGMVEAFQIPTPHGRLIDRDAVPEVSADPFEEAGFQGVLDDMPVFLEAEGRS